MTGVGASKAHRDTCKDAGIFLAQAVAAGGLDHVLAAIKRKAIF
jgi:hypothetical protein